MLSTHFFVLDSRMLSSWFGSLRFFVSNVPFKDMACKGLHLYLNMGTAVFAVVSDQQSSGIAVIRLNNIDNNYII